MEKTIVFLGWILLIVSILFVISVILKIKAKGEVYETLSKICLMMLSIIGVIIGILGLLAKRASASSFFGSSL
jgi:uncharacterized membrane protein YhaH (DUF805 family)